MNDERETPDELFNVLDIEFNFQFDLAASIENRKTEDFSTNSLEVPWSFFNRGPMWLNPPYSRGNIDKFMKKAYEESLNGCTIVCLVRDDPSTNWYRDYVDGRAVEVRRLVRRVRFIGADSCYNFPCCIVVYKPPVKGHSGVPLYEPTKYFLWDWKQENDTMAESKITPDESVELPEADDCGGGSVEPKPSDFTWEESKEFIIELDHDKYYFVEQCIRYEEE